MKTLQIIYVGFAAVLLGCGGLGNLYVPEGDTEDEAPVECADISLGGVSSVFISPGGVPQEETINITNGSLLFLQSRAPGDATVNLSVSGLPTGVTVTFDRNPVTVGLNSTESVGATFAASSSASSTFTTINIVVQQPGCTAVNMPMMLDVGGGGE